MSNKTRSHSRRRRPRTDAELIANSLCRIETASKSWKESDHEDDLGKFVGTGSRPRLLSGDDEKLANNKE